MSAKKLAAGFCQKAQRRHHHCPCKLCIPKGNTTKGGQEALESTSDTRLATVHHPTHCRSMSHWPKTITVWCIGRWFVERKPPCVEWCPVWQQRLPRSSTPLLLPFLHAVVVAVIAACDQYCRTQRVSIYLVVPSTHRLETDSSLPPAASALTHNNTQFENRPKTLPF